MSCWCPRRRHTRAPCRPPPQRSMGRWRREQRQSPCTGALGAREGSVASHPPKNSPPPPPEPLPLPPPDDGRALGEEGAGVGAGAGCAAFLAVGVEVVPFPEEPPKNSGGGFCCACRVSWVAGCDEAGGGRWSDAG